METKFITLFGEDNEVAQWGFDEAKIASHMRVAKDGLNTGGRYARPPSLREADYIPKDAIGGGFQKAAALMASVGKRLSCRRQWA